MKDFSLIAILTSIDIYLKYFFSTFTLKPYSFLPFLDLYITENRGIALSMLDDLNDEMQFVLTLTIFFVLVFLISQYFRSEGRFQKFAIIIIFAGGLGNFLERIYHGYVRALGEHAGARSIGITFDAFMFVLNVEPD